MINLKETTTIHCQNCLSSSLFYYQIFSILQKKICTKLINLQNKKNPTQTLTTPHTWTYEEVRKFHSIFYLFCPLISLEFNEAQWDNLVRIFFVKLNKIMFYGLEKTKITFMCLLLAWFFLYALQFRCTVAVKLNDKFWKESNWMYFVYYDFWLI